MSVISWLEGAEGLEVFLRNQSLFATWVKSLKFILTTLLLFDVQGVGLANTFIFKHCIFLAFSILDYFLVVFRFGDFSQCNESTMADDAQFLLCCNQDMKVYWDQVSLNVCKKNPNPNQTINPNFHHIPSFKKSWKLTMGLWAWLLVYHKLNRF